MVSRRVFLTGAVAAGVASSATKPEAALLFESIGKTSDNVSASTATDAGGISWPEGQALPHFPRARHLLVADLEEVPRDEQVLFACLQGIVNRTLPRIYLLQPGDQGKQTWLTDGLGITYTMLDSRWRLLEEFADVPTGIVIYDPDVLDTINAATGLAGLRDALAVSPELAAKLAADGYDYPVLEDLRGRFTGRLDVYQWTYDNLWPEATHRMLVGLKPEGQRTGSAYLRDYPVANRSLVIWLDSAIPAERALYACFLADMPTNSPYLGWFPPGEFSSTQLCSENAVYVVPADWFANMSVWSGTRAEPIAQPKAKAPRLRNKIYVTFTMSEGDNLQYNQRVLRRIWGDPARGSVPLNWGISPLLLDAAPAMLRYYQSTATPNDHFMAGPSGAGYINPTPWPDADFRTYTRHSGKYIEAAGLETVYVLNRVNGPSVWMTEHEVTAYSEDIDPAGVMFGWERCTLTKMLTDDLPQSVVMLNNNVAELKASIAEASRGWDGNSPLFLSMGVLAMAMTPTDVAGVIAELGPEYEVVRADQYFDLIRMANRLDPINDDDVPEFAHVVPQGQMTATATSSLEGSGPQNAIDSDDATLWHSATGPENPLPQAITLDLGGDYVTRALVYTPRQDVSCNGTIMGFRIAVSTDGAAFTEVAQGEWSYSYHRKYAEWQPVTARFIRLEAVEGYKGLASAAEVNVAYEPEA
ncbi:discoidin domain-containing protein [Actinopolymorpha sp. B9G3]|uniref:discoidin domain-containing protein n=1 Tax=Actinopolymorpha sp. B9G3 TaxID=3158970 RepID=UPI0032D8EFB8